MPTARARVRPHSLWPTETPIFYIPFEAGVDVHTGLALATGASEASPIRAAFVKFCDEMLGWCEEDGRASWDELAVLFAVRGAKQYFLAEPGTASISAPSGEMWWDAAWQHERLGVWLSTEDPEWPATNCIDNDASTTCCTETQADPWISIQLPDWSHVDQVLVHSCKHDTCKELLFPLTLHVAHGWGDPAKASWSKRCVTQAITRTGADPFVANCGDDTASFVTLQLPGPSRRLCLSELRAFAPSKGQRVEVQLVVPKEKQEAVRKEIDVNAAATVCSVHPTHIHVITY
jgi:hypothetical protein